MAWAPYSSTVFSAVTEEGKVILYDLDITKYKPICSQKIVSFKVGVLNSLMWNTYYPYIFISCAAEFIVHIFHKDFPNSIMRFDLGAQVGL